MKNEKLNHSCSHLLAAAVLELWPDVLPTLGPAIENGFYYDFDFGNKKVSDDDLQIIEDKMHEISLTWTNFEREEIEPKKAQEIYKNNPYKLELVAEHSGEGETITIYKSGNFSDLCRGGHIDPSLIPIKYFKLLSLAGAYWRGSEKNRMLTRIYGTCWSSQKELDSHLTMIEESKKRDHRTIGKDLNLFVFSDLVGKGLPLLTPKGATIRRELERFVVDEELKRGYQHVLTPPLAKTDLYKTSGHYPYYKDTMYPVMKVDDEELILRPMTCPHHFMLYKSSLHSYKELPLRYAELSPQYRYEKSGELTGLMRVRMFTLADAHIFATKEQAKQVISEVLDLIQDVNSIFGMTKGQDYRYRLSLGDRSDSKKFYKDDAAWEYAEDVLRNVLTERAEPFFDGLGEAAFYGPKIDVQVKKANGHEETAFTVQYDFVMPTRFDLKFIDADGKESQPIVIHRSSIGAFERTMAFLIEKFAGAFPTWLSPIQVKVLPISEKHQQYAMEIVTKLRSAGIRTELDDRNESLNSKIRDAQMEKIPYMLILGEKEMTAQTVMQRGRNGKQSGPFSLEEFISNIKKEIDDKLIV
jgi:threonyl-tRNA synthetase